MTAAKITTIDASTIITVPKEAADYKDPTMLAPEAVATASAATAATSSSSSSSSTLSIEEDEKEGGQHENEHPADETAAAADHARIIRLPPPIYALLAQQLEYYFSVTNLSRDTYLATLRDLNAGYVPVSILAQFGKVQALAPGPDQAGPAVCVAAIQYSTVLELVALEGDEQPNGTKTVAIRTLDALAEENMTNPRRLWAVGTRSGAAIPSSSASESSSVAAAAAVVPLIQQQQSITTPASTAATTTRTTPNTRAPVPPRPTNPASSSMPPVRTTAGAPAAAAAAASRTTQTTIILREVARDIEEQSVRNLFHFEGCPAIRTVVQVELQNCWYVLYSLFVAGVLLWIKAVWSFIYILYCIAPATHFFFGPFSLSLSLPYLRIYSME